MSYVAVPSSTQHSSSAWCTDWGAASSSHPSYRHRRTLRCPPTRCSFSNADHMTGTPRSTPKAEQETQCAKQDPHSLCRGCVRDVPAFELEKPRVTSTADQQLAPRVR